MEAVPSPEQTSDSAVTERPVLLGSEDTTLEGPPPSTPSHCSWTCKQIATIQRPKSRLETGAVRPLILSGGWDGLG